MTAFFAIAMGVCMLATILYLLVLGVIQGPNATVSDAEGRPAFIGMCLGLIFFVAAMVSMMLEDRR